MNKSNYYARRALLMLLGIALIAAARAEQMYVEDELVLNVYAEPDQASESVATLQTGDAVETLDEVDDFLLVRLSDGVEGWVGASYLTTEAPAVIRLRALQAEQKAAAQKSQQAEKALNEQLAKLKEQNAALEAQVNELKEQAAVLTEAAREPDPPPQVEDAPEKISRQGYGFSSAWIWAPLVLVGGGIGYLLGYQSLARRIRNKFGGVKIY